MAGRHGPTGAHAVDLGQQRDNQKTETMTKRTGASLLQTINDATTSTILTLGFKPEQAARMLRVRRVLPLLEDTKTPQIDARKLWERIGKPQGRFRDWAANYVKPLLERPELSAEISALTVKARGTPRIDYLLSRDVAAQLAMQARTPEGEEIRVYFLDMERLALRLSEHMGIRVAAIVGTDNKVTHTLTRRTAEHVKLGKVDGPVRVVSIERERLLKSTICEVLTGHSTSYWRETFGKGIRDMLNPEDLLQYSKCYETAWALINAGEGNKAKLVAILTPSYGGLIDPAKYSKA